MTKREQPNLALLDVRMPGMSGYEVCIKIKSNQETKHIPVVFLSAKGQESEIKNGYDSGAVDYILKPFAPDQLLNRLLEILNNQSDGENLISL
jgi:DNA-binding response OmpR family regulator